MVTGMQTLPAPMGRLSAKFSSWTPSDAVLQVKLESLTRHKTWSTNVKSTVHKYSLGFNGDGGADNTSPTGRLSAKFNSWTPSDAVLQVKLESLTRHKTSSTVCLRPCSDGFSICYSTVTLNFDLLTTIIIIIFLPSVGVPEGGKKLIVKERKMLILQWPVIRAVLVSKALV